MSLFLQVFELFVLAIPVACVAWTVTHEEVLREPREYCVKRSTEGKSVLERKFFYLFTCEYCFSHYVVVLFLLLTHYKLVYDDFKGYILSGFALVWIANVYMSAFLYLRLKIKKERDETKILEEQQNSAEK